MQFRRVALAFVALAASGAPALAQDDSPAFSAFEAECRQGDQITPGCEMNIFGLYAEANNTTPDRVICDDAALWAARDNKPAGFADIDWKDAVAELVAAPGVCQVGDVPPPSCPEGSPDPIVVKSWSTTPEPESGEGAIRLVHVLTNTLDYDLAEVDTVVRFFDVASNELFLDTVKPAGPITASADFEATTLFTGDTQIFANPDAFKLLACTTRVVDGNAVEHTF